MPSIRLNKNDRENLLVKLKDGHDLESAGASLGLSGAQIDLARDSFGDEIATAFKTGTGKLKAKIMQNALDEDNSAVLLKLLEQREKQAESSADPITLVERVIVNMPSCPHCDHLTSSTSITPIHKETTNDQQLKRT